MLYMVSYPDDIHILLNAYKSVTIAQNLASTFFSVSCNAHSLLAF